MILIEYGTRLEEKISPLQNYGISELNELQIIIRISFIFTTATHKVEGKDIN